MHTGWPSDLVKRVLRITEPTPLPSLGGELTPEITLDNDPVEWWLFKQKRIWTFAQTVAAGGVGNFSLAQASPPPNASIVTVVTGISNRSAAGQNLALLLHSADQSTGFTNASVRETRLAQGPNLGRAATRAGVNNGLAVVAGTALDELSPGDHRDYPDGLCIVMPGWFFVAKGGTANTAITVYMYGYERVLTPEELSIGT